jgi:hypothetical protein
MFNKMALSKIPPREIHSGEEEEFSDFLRQLVGANMLEPVVEGVARQIIGRGLDSLTERQKGVLHQILRNYTIAHCGVCKNEIRWSEMFMAEDSGLCDRCEYNLSKDD